MLTVREILKLFCDNMSFFTVDCSDKYRMYLSYCIKFYVILACITSVTNICAICVDITLVFII